MQRSKSQIFSFHPDLGEWILTLPPNSSDIFLNSGLDGRCFRAHRLVLASVSPVLQSVLDTSCQFCGGEPEDNPVLTFAHVPGSVLENFLALCYTGVSLSVKTELEESELKEFCSELKLFFIESLTRAPVSGQFDLQNVPDFCSQDVCVGYVEFDSLKNDISTHDVLKLAHVHPDIVEQNFEDLIAAGH